MVQSKSQASYPIYRLVILLILSVFVASCGWIGNSESPQAEDDHPLIKKAKRKIKIKETDQAIALYIRALEENPRLARAHLELALVYDEHQEDYIRAIYHYRRFLELNPKSEKRELIEDAIRHARMAFASSLPNRPSEAVKVIAELNLEIKRLKAQNLEFSRMLQTRNGGPARASELARHQREPAPPAPPPPRPRVYEVKSGDTLTRISLKVYNTPNRWKEIYTANKAELSSQSELRIGQELVIP